jgi:hypothetical protein
VSIWELELAPNCQNYGIGFTVTFRLICRESAQGGRLELREKSGTGTLFRISLIA